MDPVDPAALDYRLASALANLDEKDRAKHHVLRALNEAPRYRDAHRLLLQLTEDTAAESVEDKTAEATETTDEPVKVEPEEDATVESP